MYQCFKFKSHFSLVFFLASAVLLTGCGGSSKSVDEVDNIYPDCSDSANDYSGCWVAESCTPGDANSGASGRIFLRYRDDSTALYDGQADLYGLSYENETCSGEPVKLDTVVTDVRFKKSTVDCLDTGGTMLQPGCSNLQAVDINGNNLEGVFYGLGNLYVSNGNRLCQQEDFTGPIDLSDGACLSRFNQ